MSFLSPNKFTIEQQIARAQLQSGDQNLERKAEEDIGSYPSLGTVYSLKTKKFTSEEIKEVEIYIAEQRAKYPDSLKELFSLWEIMVKGKGDILLSTQRQSQNLSQSVVPGNISNTPIATSLDISNYNLEACANYAQEHLLKYGKTIQDLQGALEKKGNTTLEKTGVFDKSTLNAVVLYNKNIVKNESGLVSDQTIRSLFEITGIPNNLSPSSPNIVPGPTRRVDNLPEPTRGSVVRQDTPPQAQVAPAQQIQVVPETVEASPTIVQLTQAMEEFRKTYKAVNDKTNKILPDHEKDIESRNKAIQQAAGAVIKILQTLNPSKLSESERKTYESIKLEVAKYFSNELSGIKSRQYVDYSFAFSLAESIIAPILKESNITLPSSPTQADIEKRMKSINPSLHARYVEALRKGWTPGQFLSNPKIRAEWADVQSKINGEYEDAVQKKLAELMGNNAILKTPEQYEALALMTSIMGSSNFLDFKKRNIDAWIQTGGAIGSGIGGAIAGVGMIGLTGWTGVGAVAGASVIGASIATAGAAFSRGRYDEKYLLTEGGINLATFGIAGKIGMVAKAKYIDQGSKIAGYSLDGATGLALGVSSEYTRALTDGADFKDLPHGKMILMQLPWALLPMTMGSLAHLKKRSENINKAAQTIRSQANLGAHADAALTAEAIAPEVNAVANAARAQVQENHTVTPTNTTVTPSHTPSVVPTAEVQAAPGQPVHPTTTATTSPGAKPAPHATTSEAPRTQEATTSTPPVPESTPHTAAPEAPRAVATPAPQMNEQQFTEWFTALIPKVDKKKFPVGSTIKSEGIEITALEGGKYSMKHNGTVYNYDSHAELTANIGKIIKTPSERLALLKSTESARVLNHMQGYTGIEVPGVPGLRWKHDGHGKMSFERKNPENGSWTPVEIATLTPDEQLAAVAHWYQVKPIQIREGVKKAEGETVHGALESHGLLDWFKKQPAAAQHKIESGFNAAKEKSINGSKYIFVDGPKGIAQAITGIGKSTVTLPGAIGWGVGFEALDLMIEPGERELSLNNAGELIFRIAALRYMGIIRGTGAIALQNWITGAYLQSPGAQVPPPTAK